MKNGKGYFLVKVESEEVTEGGIIVAKSEKANPKAFKGEVVAGNTSDVKVGMTVWCDRRESAELEGGIHAVKECGIYAIV